MSEIDDLGPRLNVTIWALTGVAALFLGLRIYCKVWRGRPVRLDDFVLVISWFALAVSCSLLSVNVTLGYGRHSADIDPANFDYVLLVSFLAGFFSILAACWSKISFAITLLRVVSGAGIAVGVDNGVAVRDPSRNSSGIIGGGGGNGGGNGPGLAILARLARLARPLLWAVIASVNLVLGASATVQFAQCWPPERLWRPASPGACWPRRAVVRYNVFAAAYSGCVDVLLAAMPWLVVWSATTIGRREKLSALFAMSMGVFAGITSFLKIRSIDAIESNDMIDSVTLLIFGIAESAITIVAVSIPILRALVYISPRRPEPRFYQLPPPPEGPDLAAPPLVDGVVAKVDGAGARSHARGANKG